MTKAADNIRILAAAMVEKAKSGHPGGSMSGADFVQVLYSEFLIHDPENPCWEARDRFFLDPGHMSPMLYAQLCMTGHYTMEELQQLRQWGSVTPGHPERNVVRGIENTSGPLGQGHTFAVGAAIAAENSTDVTFTIGSTYIRKSEDAKLVALAEWLKANPDFTVALVGYADRETGTTKGNLELSKKRAAVVSARLAKLGVDENRISSDYKGDTVQPFQVNDKNRVVLCTVK